MQKEEKYHAAAGYSWLLKEEAMSLAQDDMLRRIKVALRDVPSSERPEDVRVAREYRQAGTASPAELITRFTERLVDYKAKVQRVMLAELPSAIAAACAARGIGRLVAPADLPEGWVPTEVELLRDMAGALSNQQLDASDGVLTGCALGIAQTGTIVLDGGPAQGRRALTLLPDYHLCVVRVDQIVELVPEAIARMVAAGAERRPITLISGPSATSDIELSRVEGVHGPRTLEVLIVAVE
jgi:L-lactate dehydrogenase complex protein LldG